MAVAVYSIPELTLISACDAIGTWVEPGTWVYGGAPAVETDYFIQNTGCISKTFGGASPNLGGMIFDTGADQALTSSEVFMIWVWHGAPNAMDTYANGGMRLIVGSASTAFKAWAVLGSDTYAYGGWQCIPVDPAITAETSVGSPATGVHQWFGMVAKSINAVSKGNPLAVDISRYGRGTLQIVSGEAGAYGTFLGAAAADQALTARWGLCQLIAGTYVVQGHFLMGVAATAVDFRDSNRNIVIANTLKVQSTFNLFEIRHASSRVDWTNINITALGTVSRCDFTVTDNADVNIADCAFTDMGVFTLLGATAITTSTFRSCGAITAPGSDLSGSSVITSRAAADTSAVIWDVNTDPDTFMDDMTFSKGTAAHHAIELGTTSPTTVTFRRCTFTGFNAADAQNDSVIHVKRTTGSVTINAIACTGTVSYKTAGATVTVVADAVTLTINVKDHLAANLQNARVLLKTAAGGPYPFDVTVTITRSGTTATVAHTAHLLKTNDFVQILGADQYDYVGVFQITRIDDNSYSYTVANSPTTPATGTIKATFAPLYGLTDASGNISTSRIYSSVQPVSGWVRKQSADPYFKTSALGGSVSATTGYSASVQMILDQ